MKALCRNPPFHSSCWVKDKGPECLLGQSSLFQQVPAHEGTQLPPRKSQGHSPLPYLASRNLDLKIITASQVLCLSCIWMELNFR